MTSPSELRLALRPSSRMRWALLVAYVGAAGCLFAAALPAWAQGALGLALIWLGYRQWGLYALLGRPDSVIGIEFHVDEGWRVLTRDGKIHQMRLASSSFAHPVLSVLVFHGAHAKSRSVALLPDMCDSRSIRRLRTLVRTGVLAH